MRGSTQAATLIAAMIVVAFVTQPARSATCASTPVEARGEPSRFVWLAKTKARSNWRRKVRAMPGLGSSYANWARAEATEERCLTGPLGTLCIFTGTPCLP